jgi:hypothetical protein
MGRTSVDPTQLLEELRQDDDSESLLDRLLLGLESLSESETLLVISGFVTPFAREQTVLYSYDRTSGRGHRGGKGESHQPQYPREQARAQGRRK